MGKVAVLGSFMMDLIANAPRRPLPGETLVGTGFAIHLGGKGFNQAVAAARFGASAAMLGRLGEDDFGDDFLRFLDAEGIRSDGVVRDEHSGTGVGLPVVEPNGQNSIIIIPRANSRVDRQQILEAADIIASADVLLLQLELPPASALLAAEIASQSGTKIVLNPAPFGPTPDELFHLTDILVPNELEGAELADLEDDGMGATEAVSAIAARFGMRDVILTMGEKGVLVASEGTMTHVPSHPVDAVDTVGAGDVFCGVLAAALSDGVALLDAVHYGNAAAALAVTKAGGSSSVPQRREIESMLDPSASVSTGHRARR